MNELYAAFLLGEIIGLIYGLLIMFLINEAIKKEKEI
jgi:uncharacterized membrane-anchored protein YhcB (DUF1043 family)